MLKVLTQQTTYLPGTKKINKEISTKLGWQHLGDNIDIGHQGTLKIQNKGTNWYTKLKGWKQLSIITQGDEKKFKKQNTKQFKTSSQKSQKTVKKQNTKQLFCSITQVWFSSHTNFIHPLRQPLMDPPFHLQNLTEFLQDN